MKTVRPAAECVEYDLSTTRSDRPDTDQRFPPGIVGTTTSRNRCPNYERIAVELLSRIVRITTVERRGRQCTCQERSRKQVHSNASASLESRERGELARDDRGVRGGDQKTTRAPREIVPPGGTTRKTRPTTCFRTHEHDGTAPETSSSIRSVSNGVSRQPARRARRDAIP